MSDIMAKQPNNQPVEQNYRRELRAARLAIRRMTRACNIHEESHAIGKAALKRINAALKSLET